MLVLSRKKDQKIIIPLARETLEKLQAIDAEHAIEITIVRTGDTVRVGLEMPAVVPAYRPDAVAPKQDVRFVPLAPGSSQ